MNIKNCKMFASSQSYEFYVDEKHKSELRELFYVTEGLLYRTDKKENLKKEDFKQTIGNKEVKEHLIRMDYKNTKTICQATLYYHKKEMMKMYKLKDNVTLEEIKDFKDTVQRDTELDFNDYFEPVPKLPKVKLEETKDIYNKECILLFGFELEE